MGALEAQRSMSHIPICNIDQLADADTIIFGAPIRYGNRLDEITGGSPYGASTIAGPNGYRWPSENELGAARFQGRHVETLASKMVG